MEDRSAAIRNLALGLRSAAAVLFLAGCAAGGRGNPFVEATNTEHYSLRVESGNSFDVDIYVNPSGRRQLIGTIPGNGLDYFEFEYPAGRPLNVELEGRMGDRYRIPPILFPGGGRVELLVYEDLRRSGFVRR